jgi:plasmid stabilization system protein ParE
VRRGRAAERGLQRSHGGSTADRRRTEPVIQPEAIMPRGDKSKYTDKQKRKAEHIEEGYEARGVSEDEAERRAWATVNKQDGGGKKSGSARKSASKSTAKSAKKAKKR